MYKTIPKINKDIKKPTLLKIQSISDDRGVLVPITDDIDHNLFHRCYFVEDYGKGVIRGLHYHKQEIKVFSIVSGAGKFITLEIPPEMADRNDENEIQMYIKENPESLKSFVLSSRHHGVLIIPANFANGWVSLEDNTVLVSLSNMRHETAQHDDIRINPYLIGEEKWKTIGR